MATYSKWAAAKLYTTKTPITSADLLNDRVLPFFEDQGMGVLRILTDRGTEYCGKAEQHDYELFLAVNDIEHTKTKAHHPQTNGICERFHKTILQEFYQTAFRRKLYGSLQALQEDLDAWIERYNAERTHEGKMCCGRTPLATMLAGKEIWDEKVAALNCARPDNRHGSETGNCQIKSRLLQIIQGAMSRCRSLWQSSTATCEVGRTTSAMAIRAGRFARSTRRRSIGSRNTCSSIAVNVLIVPLRA